MNIIDFLLSPEQVDDLKAQPLLRPKLNAYFLHYTATDEEKTQLHMEFINTDEKGQPTLQRNATYVCYLKSNGDYDWVDITKKFLKIDDGDKKIPLDELSKHPKAIKLLSDLFQSTCRNTTRDMLNPKQPEQWLLTENIKQAETNVDTNKGKQRKISPSPSDKSTAVPDIESSPLFTPPKSKIKKMPRLHEKIDLKDIYPDGRLLSKETIALFHKTFPNPKEGQRFSKKELATKGIYSPYNLIIAGGELHAIYFGVKKDKQIGSGGFGVVKVAQNQDNIKQEAYKSQLKKPSKSRAEFEKDINEEFRLTQKAGGIEASHQVPIFHIRKENLAEQYSFLMELGEGIPMEKLYTSGLINTLSPVQIIKIAANIVDEIRRLHKEGIIHRDIKESNILLDPVTGAVKIIDFGLSAEEDKKQSKSMTDVDRHGTKGYIAPELFPKDISEDITRFTYNEATECFAAGKVLLRLLFNVNAFQQLDKRNILLNKDRIPNAALRENLWQLMVNMVGPADKRYSLEIVSNHLHEAENAFPEAHAKLSLVGILNLDEYREGTSTQRDTLRKALSIFDKVWVVEKEALHSFKDYAMIGRELEEGNVRIDGNIFLGATIAQAVASIPEKVKEDEIENKGINKYYFITAEPASLQNDTPSTEITIIPCKEEKTMDEYKRVIINDLANSSVRESDLEKVIHALDAELERINKKEIKISSKAAKEKYTKLQSFINESKNYLITQKNNNSLNYERLEEELIKLYSKTSVVPSRVVPRMLSKAFSFYKPISSTAIAVKSEIDPVKEEGKEIHSKEDEVRKHHPKLRNKS